MSDTDKAAEKLARSIRTSKTATGATPKKKAKKAPAKKAPARKTSTKKKSARTTPARQTSPRKGAGPSRKPRQAADRDRIATAPTGRARPGDAGPGSHARGGLRWPD
jgi:hypothetical protein